MGNLFILGAADPEMVAIEAALVAAGEKFVHASIGGVRVTPAKAYQCDPVEGATHWVECAPGKHPDGAVVIDHHRAGDPGFGGAPAKFLESSSIGQTLMALAIIKRPGSEARIVLADHPTVENFDGTRPQVWCVETNRWVRRAGSFYGGVESTSEFREVRPEHVLTAAGDHCPGAAYAGHCQGVGPGALMAHRAKASAAFQKKAVEDVLKELDQAIDEIEHAKFISIGGVDVADFRGMEVPQLPEACLRTGFGVVYSLKEKDGRTKVGILGCGEGTPAGIAPVKAFIETWAVSQGLAGIYGDPVRGFAGGYKGE
jgi:hypothetical protein